MWPSSCAGLPEQAIKYIAGGHAAQSALRQRNTAEPAPAHARASAVEANKRIKRLRRNGALVAHNDAAANIDAHVSVQQTRRAGTTVRRVGHDHAHLQRRTIGAVAPGVKHVARVAAKVAHAGVAEYVGNPSGAPVQARRRGGVACVDDSLLLARAGILLRSSGRIRSATRA